MIYIIRHGKTELNKNNVLQGRSNCPLNEKGVRQAEEAAKMLRQRGVTFDYVFTSPLIRAVQTAEIVAPGVKAVTDERLIEMDYGPYEGAGLKNLAPEVLTFFSDFINNPAPEGMEQLSSVVRRAGEFLEETAEYREILDEGRHVVLCHYPIVSFRDHYFSWYHLYGHVHNSFEANVTENARRLLQRLYVREDVCLMFNAGAMMPRMNYTPRSLEEITAASPGGGSGT